MATAAAPGKSKGPIIDPALCRCCRSIKKCRLLTTEYEWMGKKEIYSDMFMDCFGLLVSTLIDKQIYFFSNNYSRSDSILTCLRYYI